MSRYLIVTPGNGKIWNDVFKKDSAIVCPASASSKETALFNSLNDGDIILVPVNGGIAVAKATSSAGADRRAVQYKKGRGGAPDVIPKTCLSPALRNMINSKYPVVSIDAFQGEIDALLAPGSGAWIYSMNEEKMKEFRNKLKDIVQNGYANVELMKEILIANGYCIRDAPNLPRKDAVIVAECRSSFGNREKLFFKIRSDRGRRDDDYVDAMINAKNAFPDIAGHRGIFITTTDHIAESAKALALANNMEAWTVSGMIDLIIESMDKLSPDIKKRLGIQVAPAAFVY